MRTTTGRLDRWDTIKVVGDIHPIDVRSLESAAGGAFLKRPVWLLVDLTDVGFCCAEGIRWVRQSQERIAKTGGKLRVAAVKDGPLGGMLRILEVDARDIPFSVATALDGDVAFVTVTGELDMATVPVLQQHLEPFRRQVSSVEFELEGLTFMDLTGFRCLLFSLNEDGTGVTFRNPSPPVRHLFELIGPSMPPSKVNFDPRMRTTFEPWSGPATPGTEIVAEAPVMGVIEGTDDRRAARRYAMNRAARRYATNDGRIVVSDPGSVDAGCPGLGEEPEHPALLVEEGTTK
jgi:anti-anti-sigma factor